MKKKFSLFIALVLIMSVCLSLNVLALSPYSKIEAESYNGSNGIQTESCSEGGRNVGYINNGDWIKFNGVDFGNGASKVDFRVASNTSGGTIEVRLGSNTGTLVGTASVSNTGGWQSWTTVSCNINGASGVKDLFLVFKGGSGYLFNLNWIQFTATSGGSGTNTAGIVYQVIQGHDGDPDPDDNGAALAGYFAIKRNAEQFSGRVEYLGFVYGDTTEKRQNSMINGGGGSYNGSNGKANYQFYKQYTKPALQSVGCTVFYDTTTQTYNFNATQLSQMTTSGQFVANKILWAINNSNATTKYRVVYSCGGGMNVSAEAVKYLRNIGKSEALIKEHFLAVQHSKWNFTDATEVTAQNIIKPYYVAITDQNGPVGHGDGVPLAVSATRTSSTFANAWKVAVAGQAPVPAIPGLGAIDDISDAGSHSFSSNVTVLDANWNRRNNGFDNRVNYTQYNVQRVKADMCD